MCFSSPKPPDVPPPPPQAVIPPAPTVMPSKVSEQTVADRQKKIQNLRYGLASTIKAGRGISGAGAELQPVAGEGKKTLG